MTGQPNDHGFLKSRPGGEPILIEGLFRASPERLFNAFTVPEEVSGWFTPVDGRLVAAEIDLKVGGKWRFVVDRTSEKEISFEGEYLEINPPARLEFSWRHVVAFTDGRREETDRSHVTVTFTAAGEATEVRLHHAEIKTESARFGVGGGWDGCFGLLKDYLL